MSDQAGGERPENTGDFKGQAGLFGAMRAGVAGRVESPVIQADEGAITKRFGGRPAGARNIATRQRMAMFSQIAGDPFLQSARILAMPLAQLAGELGCSPLEAAEFQQRERLAVQPYFMSKAPVDVNLNDKSPPALHLHFPAAVGAPGGAAALPGGGGAVALFEQARAALGPVIEGEAEELESDDNSTA